MAENGDERNGEARGENSLSRGLKWLFILAFALMFAGVLLVVAFAALGSGGSASAGIVIFIGPFPIVLGAGPDAVWLILIGLAVAAISLALFVFKRRK
ncbi:MAG: DUF131 domain-containing protein [Candidatus Bathyarchaeia archaeon]